jgi:predicted ATP-grasp superfamily ATP-dependent carboligase
MSLTILIHEWVTGGGLADSTLPRSWAAEGTAMRRAIAQDFASIPLLPTRVIVTLDFRLPDDAGPWEIVRVGEEEVETVRSLASQADFTLIIAPETKGILQDWAVELERGRIRSLGSTPTAIGVTGDKLRSAERLTENGIATPPTRLLGSEPHLPIDAVYPAVLKPIDGAGSLDTYLVESAESRRPGKPQLASCLFQPYIPGTAMSASYLVDEAGDPHLIGIGTQNLVIRQGRIEYLGGEIPDIRAVDDTSLRSAIRAVPGLRGFVGVDFVLDERTGAVTVIEINPRPTTSCVGLSEVLPSGHLARAWLAACGGPFAHRPDTFTELADELEGRQAVAFAADGTILRNYKRKP